MCNYILFNCNCSHMYLILLFDYRHFAMYCVINRAKAIIYRLGGTYA